jgi:hypothetical protein
MFTSCDLRLAASQVRNDAKELYMKRRSHCLDSTRWSRVGVCSCARNTLQIIPAQLWMRPGLHCNLLHVTPRRLVVDCLALVDGSSWTEYPHPLIPSLDRAL